MHGSTHLRKLLSSHPLQVLPADKRELILPKAVITAVFAENPVGQRRQSCRTNENRSIYRAEEKTMSEIAIHYLIEMCLFFLQFCQWLLHQFVVSCVATDQRGASRPHAVLLSCLPSSKQLSKKHDSAEPKNEWAAEEEGQNRHTLTAASRTAGCELRHM